jgi:hypothetical protein
MKHLFIVICLFINISVNAQVTWNMGMNITSSAYDNEHPRIVIDGSGNPMVIWGRLSDATVHFSKFDGTSWSTPLMVNSNNIQVATASWMGPDIASKGDTIYVVVKRIPENADTNRIFLYRSFNGGATFMSPVELAFIADSVSRFPTVAIDASGNPVIAYMKFNSTFGQSRWVVTKSTDYGLTFTTDIKASGWSGPTAEVCDCCPGSIVIDDNFSAMLYRDNLANLRDTWSGFSTDGAMSFNSGIAVDNNNWMISSCPASGPDAIVYGDTLYSVFMSSGTGSYRTYLSKTSIANQMLASVNALSASVPGLTQQNYPRIDRYGNSAGIVWKQNVSGISQLPLLLTNNINNGFPLAYDTVDLGDITNADIALADGKVYVVWQDDNSNTVKFRSGTFLTSTAINEQQTNEMSISPNPASHEVNIYTSFTEPFQIEIFDMAGRKLRTEIITSRNSKINLTLFQSGLYFIKLNQGSKHFIYKLVKL